MTVKIETEDKTKTFDSKDEEFHEIKDLLEEQGVDYEVTENGVEANSEESTPAEVVEPIESEESTEKPVRASEENAISNLDDPIEFLKQGNEELVTEIRGTKVIKKKGFRLLQHHFGISTSSEVIVGPEETDYEFCRVKARAEKPDGQYAEAHASASVSRGDDKGVLVSMADTRAKSRALSDLTGSGAIAMAEAKGTDLEES